MRETASLAEAYGRHDLPASLMQRLAYMEQVARAASAQAASYARVQAPPPAQPRQPSRGAQAIVVAWFSLGVLTSGAIGAGALVGLRALESGWNPMALAAAWAKTPLVATAPGPKAAWETVQVTIARSEQGRAPLPLQVTAAEDAPVTLVVQGLPAGVRLSHGESLGWSGWVLKRADLDGLHLTLDDGAPETFELKITALATPGTRTLGSIVQVRLVDRAVPKEAALKDAVEGEGAPPRAPVAEPVRRPAAVNLKGLGQQLAAAAPWPEGAAGLSFVARGPEGSIGRQIWWQMPPLP